MPYRGQTQFNNTIHELASQSVGNSYRNTNIKLGLLLQGKQDAQTFTIQSSRSNVDNSNFFINTDFDQISLGIDITVPTSSVQFRIASTNVNDDLTGTGAEIIRIFGLDENWEPVMEDVILDGQNTVDTVRTNWFRVNQLLVLSSNNSNNDTKNAGYIYLSDTADTFVLGEPQNRLYCSIAPLHNKSTHGIFSVKSGHSFISTHYKATTDASTTKPAQAENDIKFLNIPEFTLVDLTFGQSNINFDLDGIPNVPEKSDIIIKTKAATPTNIDRITIWWSGIIMKNSSFPNSIEFSDENL